jgi:EAL and modified HD-GYP domain-containing signal transduction protein
MDAFIARQPIFDRGQNVYGYELLFRSGWENVFPDLDLTQASARTIADSLHLLGLETLTGGRKAFFNVTREVLLADYASLLPRGQSVLEILETVDPDAEVVAACRKLRQAGYRLALDDFVHEGRASPLVGLADFVKVDFVTTGRETQRRLVQELAPLGVHLVAEKVETQEVLDEAMELGYEYFQGFFFGEPRIRSARDLPAFKLHHLHLLQEIHEAELDFDRVEAILKREMSFCYKLFRYINSAAFGWRNRVNTIRRALVLLGENEFKKWASLVAVASMAEDKPRELLLHSIIRARFSECVGAEAGLGPRTQDLFLMGMFSLIDAVLDRPLPEILGHLPIHEDVKAALLGAESPLREVYDYTLACERGDWERLARHATRLGVDEAETPRLYLDALRWGQDSLRDGP